MIPIRDAITSRRFPAITVSLILVNLLVFLYQSYLATQPALVNDWQPWEAEELSPPPAFDPQAYSLHVRTGKDPSVYPLSASDAFIAQYALVPAEFLRGVDLPPTIPVPIWLTLISSLFLHGGLMHLVGNMLYLWVFGDNVEDAMGRARFLLFYLLCGAAAAMAQIAFSPSSSIPLLGASGAIAGVLGAYLTLFPTARVLTLIPIFFFVRLVAVPAVLVLGIWFALQLFNGVGSLGVSSGVAWFAHIGGFLAGLALVFVFRRRSAPLVLWELLGRRRSGS
ncbi:MAG: rhomboid family intramembrane serine protease [Candidatus Bipolaricaulota bacterium]